MAELEIEMLDEVEEILSCCEAEEFTGFCASLFRCLAKCMSSQHYQVLSLYLTACQKDDVSLKDSYR